MGLAWGSLVIGLVIVVLTTLSDIVGVPYKRGDGRRPRR
jgi:hypothetical protein